MGDIKHLGLEAPSLAVVAGDVEVLEEVHLELLKTVALAGFAPAARHVEGKVAGTQFHAAGFGLGGSPWKNNNAANYWRQSPMAYAHQIRTPMLILSTTGDPRVTVTQSYKLYHALKDNGTPVQFIAYPVGGHFPPDPVHQRDVRRRWIEWIARQFGPAT